MVILSPDMRPATPGKSVLSRVTTSQLRYEGRFLQAPDILCRTTFRGSLSTRLYRASDLQFAITAPGNRTPVSTRSFSSMRGRSARTQFHLFEYQTILGTGVDSCTLCGGFLRETSVCRWVAVPCCNVSTPCVLQGGLLDYADIQSVLLRGPMVATRSAEHLSQ
jgi:hypothetical protein